VLLLCLKQQLKEKIMVRKKVEIPKRGAGSAAKAKYPFTAMDVDESVLFENVSKIDIRRIRGAAYGIAAYQQKQFVCRNVENGIRVWRVK
jgi:hypothetical protein